MYPVEKLQMVFFFKDGTEFKQLPLLSKIYEVFSTSLGGEPQILPSSDGAPLDAPLCIWHSESEDIIVSRKSFTYATKVLAKDWRLVFDEVSAQIVSILDECNIVTDRVGFIIESNLGDEIHSTLNDYVNIKRFQDAKEARIDWLEKQEYFNIWTYIIINDNIRNNKMIIDVNTDIAYKISSDLGGFSALISTMKKIIEEHLENAI